jgi:deazaflavin-dependent oxidoreductase (nitroreductase family)
MNADPTVFDAGRPRRSLPARWLARTIEPIARPLAGTRWFPLWAILYHTGRTSGRAYATPIVARRTPDGFMIPLPFGDATQWARNLFAAGGGSLQFAGRRYAIAEPRVVDRETAAIHLSPPLRFVAGRLGLRQYVMVREAPTTTAVGRP